MKLYHYTDAAAVKSIVQNGKLWLTDLRFVNDSEELKNGLDLIHKYLKTLDHDRYEDDNAKATVGYVLAELEKYLKDNRPSLNLFSCSFSTVRSLLSQWRSYGTLAVEFDQEILADVLTIHECTYDLTLAVLQAKSNAANVLNSCLHSLKTHNYISPDVIQAYERMILMAAQIKHPAFREEHEKRIIVSSHGHQVQHRCKGNLFIPYIELEIPKESITSIQVGPQPHQDLIARSLMSFLDANGEGERIEVYVDTTPYRAT